METRDGAVKRHDADERVVGSNMVPMNGRAIVSFSDGSLIAINAPFPGHSAPGFGVYDTAQHAAEANVLRSLGEPDGAAFDPYL